MVPHFDEVVVDSIIAGAKPLTTPTSIDNKQ